MRKSTRRILVAALLVGFVVAGFVLIKHCRDSALETAEEVVFRVQIGDARAIVKERQIKGNVHRFVILRTPRPDRIYKGHMVVGHTPWLRIEMCHENGTCGQARYDGASWHPVALTLDEVVETLEMLTFVVECLSEIRGPTEAEKLNVMAERGGDAFDSRPAFCFHKKTCYNGLPGDPTRAYDTRERRKTENHQRESGA